MAITGATAASYNENVADEGEAEATSADAKPQVEENVRCPERHLSLESAHEDGDDPSGWEDVAGHEAPTVAVQTDVPTLVGHPGTIAIIAESVKKADKASTQCIPSTISREFTDLADQRGAAAKRTLEFEPTTSSTLKRLVQLGKESKLKKCRYNLDPNIPKDPRRKPSH